MENNIPISDNLPKLTAKQQLCYDLYVIKGLTMVEVARALNLCYSNISDKLKQIAKKHPVYSTNINNIKTSHGYVGQIAGLKVDEVMRAYGLS